jgi:hypothetical protein
MPAYDYQCLYCGNCSLSLAGLNDHMTLCSLCGNLMLRSDDDLFWQYFDKNHFKFTAKTKCPPTPTTEGDPFGGKTSIGLIPNQYRLPPLHKWTPWTDLRPWSGPLLPLACRGQIFCDKQLGKGEFDPHKPKSL